MLNKKINGYNAVCLTISSMLGAGVFLKAGSLHQLFHSNKLALLFLFFFCCFIISFIIWWLNALISDDKGDIDISLWSYRYVGRNFYNFVIKYLIHFYQPLSLTIMGIFIIDILRGSTQINSQYIIYYLAPLPVLLFMFINLISFELATKLQVGLLYITLLGILAIPLLGLYDFYNGTTINSSQPSLSTRSEHNFFSLILLGLPSIFFIYDGFYNTLYLKGKLEHESNLKKYIISGLIIISFIYAINIFSLSVISSSGKYSDIPSLKNNILLQNTFKWIVACSACLTLNSVCMGGFRMLEDIYYREKTTDVEFVKKHIFTKFNIKYSGDINHLCVWISFLGKAFLWFLLIIFVSYSGKDIFKLNDLIADILSSLIFVIIATIIFKSKDSLISQVSNTKIKLYKWISYFVAYIIYAACLYMCYTLFTSGDQSFSILFLKLFLSVWVFYLGYKWWKDE